MKRTAGKHPDFYENLNQLLWELAAMRTRDLRPLRLDLDHYFLLQAVATGRAHSEAGMVRLLGRHASFCSRAVDRLVGRGWLKKRPKPRSDDSRFRVTITRKGTGIYQDIQAGFVERVNQRLVASGTAEKAMRPVVRQVSVLNQMLRGVREDKTAPAAAGENEKIQMPLRGLEGGPQCQPAEIRRPEASDRGPHQSTLTRRCPTGRQSRMSAPSELG